MNSPLMEKQFAIGNRRNSRDSLSNALEFKSCAVLDSHLSSTLTTANYLTPLRK
jgi:hypothetical protein